MGAFKAVIFDLDGTLLDTLEDLGNATNKALIQVDQPIHNMEHYKYAVGEGIKLLAIRSLPQENQFLEDLFLDKFIMLIKKEYEISWSKCTKPYDGILNLIEKLAMKSMKMAILSNKPDDFTQKMVDFYFNKSQFAYVLGAGKFPLKPNPESALHIAKQFECNPKEIIYLGDTKTDMETAVRAGMYPVGVTWGFRERDELIQSGAKKIIDSPLELLDLV